jgi:hypothetical protein
MSIVKLNNQGVKNATAFGSITGLGSMIFIKKLTASSSATLSFVDGASGVVLDNTYKEYLFTFKNMHPANDGVNFTFQVDTGTNTNYNQTITSTAFQAFHGESGGSPTLGYASDKDQAQGTAFQVLMQPIGNGNDESGSGTLQLFNPSSSTFVKHFIGTTQYYNDGDYSQTLRTAGYINTTTALTKVQFKMSSGDIDAGDICLYGIA